MIALLVWAAAAGAAYFEETIIALGAVAALWVELSQWRRGSRLEDDLEYLRREMLDRQAEISALTARVEILRGELAAYVSADRLDVALRLDRLERSSAPAEEEPEE